MKQKLEANIKADENIKVYRHLHFSDEPEHTHEFIEIAYIYSGKGTQYVNGQAYFVKRGDLIIMGVNDVHSFKIDGEMGVLNCLIAPTFLASQTKNIFDPIEILSLTSFREFLSIESISPVIKFSSGKYFDIEYLMDAMETEFSEKKKGYISAINGYLIALLVKIFREMAESDSFEFVSNIDKITPQIIQFIEANYNRKITLEELAHESFYSPKYFSKVFKECFGKSLTQYVNELRVNQALKLLADTTLSIEDIGYDVGFSDKKQFYKIFKDLCGKTPGELRK